jgi:hypothetical protein
MSRSALSEHPNFRSLSLRDLLDARNQYHWHLMNKANVVGTAVGLYLIRKHDPWPKAGSHADGTPPDDYQRPKDEEVRTFENSQVRPYSWPCILVLVQDWEAAEEFHGKRSFEMVPPRLYMPDGRSVPVCVVEVKPGIPSPAPRIQQRFPDSYLGGGFPLVQPVQGEEHEASTGCLVTDGHRTYVLTNRHAVGEEGSPVYARVHGELVEIGRSTELQKSRVEFTKVFPEFPGNRTYLTVDVGLVDVARAGDWSSQPYGLPGRVGAMADLNELNISLQLIDRPVMAFGAASGHLEGQIKGLFYRHKARAGYEYISEFLIAPEKADQQTSPGDSGTVWHLVEDDDSAKKDATKNKEERPSPADAEAGSVLRPLAIEWGGQTLVGMDGSRFNFALATGLSTACELLDVDLVQDHNTGAVPYWGQTGHYSIASVAISVVEDPKLKAFLEANLERISFEPNELSPEDIKKKLGDGDFVELADVPDLVWKKVRADVPGGRDYARNSGPEHPNHYADIDGENGQGQTLRDVTLQGLTNMTVQAWTAWYTQNAKGEHADKWGLLPFRVWQIFTEMVSRLKAGDPTGFLCASGILSHYVGDACQPLHGSVYSDGYRDLGDGKHWSGKGVHSTYEDKMVDRHSEELLAAIGPAAEDFRGKLPSVTTGQEAAFATVQLMALAAKTLPPKELCDKYIALGGGTSRPVVDGLWTAFKQETAAVMGAGARYLAALWDAAYVAGGKPALSATAIPEKKLAALYQDAKFLPSLTLAQIGPVLQGGPAPVNPPTKAVRKPAPAGKTGRRKSPRRKTGARSTPRKRR